MTRLRLASLAATILLLAGGACSSDSLTTAPPDGGDPIVAAKLVFATQPSGAAAGAALGTQPVVKAEDASGNVATTYSGPIKVVLGNGGATGVLCCNVTVNAVNGVAAFSGLSVNTAGTYTLRASSGTLAGTQSAAFDITP
jgi:ABC-type Fe3+-hydroxamate transport system substrate-binding protein